MKHDVVHVKITKQKLLPKNQNKTQVTFKAPKNLTQATSQAWCHHDEAVPLKRDAANETLITSGICLNVRIPPSY